MAARAPAAAAAHHQAEAISFALVPPLPIKLNKSYPGLRQIYAAPQIYVVEDFLPPDACANLISFATPKMKASGMAFGGMEAAANIRTSSTVLLRRQRDVVAPLISRVSQLTGKPPCHCEDLQVSRYRAGEFYKTHFDGPGSDEKGSREFLMCGGQRLATVLVYLNTVVHGGETAFPCALSAARHLAPRLVPCLTFCLARAVCAGYSMG